MPQELLGKPAYVGMILHHDDEDVIEVGDRRVSRGTLQGDVLGRHDRQQVLA